MINTVIQIASSGKSQHEHLTKTKISETFSLTYTVIQLLKIFPALTKCECTTLCARNFAVAANSGLISLFGIIVILKFIPLHLLKGSLSLDFVSDCKGKIKIHVFRKTLQTKVNYTEKMPS